MTRRLMTDTASVVRIPRVKGAAVYEYDWTDEDIVHTGRCSVQPFSSIEDEFGRDTRVSQCRLISDDTGFAAALATDHVDYGGQLWRIDGRPQVWTLRGRHHTEFTMRLVEG
jgi:hypothetical protein